MMSMFNSPEAENYLYFSNIVAQSCLAMLPHLLSWLRNQKLLNSVFEGRALELPNILQAHDGWQLHKVN